MDSPTSGHSKENKDRAVGKQTAVNEINMVRSLLELDTEASIDFMHSLFGKSRDVDIRGPNSPLIRKPLLDNFVQKAHALILFFTRECADLLLPQECFIQYGSYIGSGSLQNHELSLYKVRRAVGRLRKATQAVETWAVEHMDRVDLFHVKKCSKTTVT
jgi:hypothetical protein